jgi:hypothetical protein
LSPISVRSEMKSPLATRLVTVFILLSLVSAAPTSAPSPIYRMVAVTVDGADPNQWILIIITPEGYAWATTPKALEHCVRRRIPKSATLQWVPQDALKGGEPLTSEADLTKLRRVCSDQGIKFVHIPAG